MQCGEMSPLLNGATRRALTQRRHAAALQICAPQTTPSWEMNSDGQAKVSCRRRSADSRSPLLIESNTSPGNPDGNCVATF